MEIGHSGAGAAALNGQSARHSKRRNRYAGLPIVPPEPGSATLRFSRFALFFTLMAWAIYMVTQLIDLAGNPVDVLETMAYLGLVTLLAASSSAYLLCRIGYFERILEHRRVPRSAIDDYFAENNPSLTIMVPSYREDPNVVRKTLLTAALYRSTPICESYS
jgi:hypothetical protein